MRCGRHWTQLLPSTARPWLQRQQLWQSGMVQTPARLPLIAFPDCCHQAAFLPPSAAPQGAQGTGYTTKRTQEGVQTTTTTVQQPMLEAREERPFSEKS